MCGITGIMAFNEIGRMHMIHLAQAVGSLSHRGPDYQGTYITDQVALGHRRLSVIDPSPQGHQPMSDSTGRYHIVYNGEIYNYQELKKRLQDYGQEFQSGTDTEVLLYLYIKHGVECLDLLNGCFAFAILDSKTNKLFLARDRFGINPLLYYLDNDKFIFGSEMRALLAYNIPRTLDYESLETYLELLYVPAPFTMISGVKKLQPGTHLTVDLNQVEQGRYYSLPSASNASPVNLSYEDSKKKLAELLEQAVVRRLISDVPLGAFLSGGIDSSVLVAIASKHIENLHTFSIGYKDHPFFDETEYATAVADKFNTNHTVYKLTKDELYQHLNQVWEHLDEPFADSSALPTYILSKYTSKKVSVALSGDGADELFGGYTKHLALQASLQVSFRNSMIRSLSAFTSYLPKSRNGMISNKIRQLDRMGKGLRMNLSERYWYWASIAGQKEAIGSLSEDALRQLDLSESNRRKNQLLDCLTNDSDLNHILRTDLKLVLPNDMLTKVDSMSMAHGLEVRVPYLDHEVVQFVMDLPVSFKVNQGMRKRILQDTYKDLLPKQLYRRPKKGFEVPLLDWMRTQLSGVIENELLHPDYIRDQGLFDMQHIQGLKRKLNSRNPGDTPARVWSLLVFQKWYQKYQPAGSLL